MPKRSPKKTRKLTVAQSKKRRRISRVLNVVIIGQLLIILWLVGGYMWRIHKDSIKKLPVVNKLSNEKKAPVGGKIISTEQPLVFSSDQILAIIHQTDKNFNLPIHNTLTKQVFSYSSTDPRNNEQITIYGRVYVPTGANLDKLPIFAFAPGTTGIGDQCAASLEQPQKRNWANYDSLLMSYASQGYIVVTTDYEGMRDESRLHHYMIGEAEGRALLDAVRATQNLAITQDLADNQKIALAGYSQGGHAAFWADKISTSYASEMHIKAVVGFGPVSNVTETLVDNTAGANINWFGPYVLTSYSDYYHKNYDVASILNPTFSQNMRSQVLNSCIDTVKLWGPKYSDVYTPSFIAAEKSGISSSRFLSLATDMEKNSLGAIATPSSKLINQGQLDNVILPQQSASFARHLCSKSPQTTYTMYKTATHYTTMVTSFVDTLNWLKQAYVSPVNGNCTS